MVTVRVDTMRGRKVRSGNVVALVAVSLVAVIGVAGLVVDGGRIMAERRQLQNAADAAALAAAIDLYHGAAVGQARKTAEVYVEKNGYVGKEAKVSIPPHSGPYQGNRDFAEVNLTVGVSTTFMAILWSNSVPVSVRAVAGKSQAPASGMGLLVLNGTAEGALVMSGTANVKVKNGSLHVNSNNSQAVKASGSPSLESPTIDMVGNYSVSSTTQLIGTVRTGMSPVKDPLAGLVQPDAAQVPVVSNSRLVLIGGSHTLQPGRYVGGIAISSGASVQLQPGVYYMDDGDLTVSASSLNGSEVTIFAERRLTLSGLSPISITPPSSGLYKGLSIFQDRAADYPVVLSGGSNMNVRGTIYAPRARVTLSGLSGIGSFGSQIIGDTMSMSGLATIGLDWSSAVAQRSGVYLVE